MNENTQYDIVIIGGGIAGLYSGIELLKRWPRRRIHIIEKYGYLGGRVTTYHKKVGELDVAWENGAGRFHSSHKMVHKLLKKYGIETAAISDKTDYLQEQQMQQVQLPQAVWEELAQVFLQPLTLLSGLSQHTVYSLCKKMYGISETQEFIHRHPYYTEIHVMRADVALKQLLGELGTREGYSTCKYGLTQLITAMADEFRQRGGTIELNNACKSIDTYQDIYTVYTAHGSIKAQKVICALHVNALKKLQIFRGWAPLKHLRMTPLLRIYMVFPTVGGKAWFSNLNKIVTPSKLRYIIPIDESKGILMVSYTDGVDTKSWMWGAGYDASDAVKAQLIANIMGELRRLLSFKIPDPLFMKAHPWYDGATAWLPGDYDVTTMSNDSCYGPSKNMYVCGESFSLRQAWMEGALEQADKMLKKIE